MLFLAKSVVFPLFVKFINKKTAAGTSGTESEAALEE